MTPKKQKVRRVLSKVAETNKGLREIKALQRLYKISPNSDVVAVLLSAGLSSASDITEMPKKDFVAAMKGRISAKEAEAVYSSASSKLSRA